MSRLVSTEVRSHPRRPVVVAPAPSARWPGRRLRLPAVVWGLVVLAGLAYGTWVLWEAFNAPRGRVGREFPFDLVYYYYPMMELAAERLSAGEIPLWNPYQCCGVPFLATAQVAVFYPGTWLALVMPVGQAIQVLMFGQVLLGGVFATMFFRALGRGHFAAGIGGLLFIFACILGQTFWPPEVSTIMWMPFLFWVVERFLQTGRARWWALFVFGTAMQILAGYPQFLVYTFYLLVPYTVLRAIHLRFAGSMRASQAPEGGAADAAIVGESPAGVEGNGRLLPPPSPPRSLRRCVALGLGCGLALGLAAIQLAPTFELVQNTVRGGSLDERAVHYLEIQRNHFFVPDDLMTNMFDPSPKMITFDFPDGSGYLGLVVPFAVFLGLLLGRYDPRVWFFALGAVVFLLLSFGYSDWSRWAYELYASVPTGNMFRTPGRLLVLTYFSVITLAVFGLDHLSGRPGDRQPLPTAVAGTLVTGAAALYAVSQMSTPEGLQTAAKCVGAAVVAVVFRGFWPVRGLAQIVLAMLILRDLAGATAPYGSLRDIPVEWGRRPHWGGVAPIPSIELQEVVNQAGLERVSMPPLRPNKISRPTPRFYSINEYEPLLPQRWKHINRALGGDPGWTMSEVDPEQHPAIYDLASVRHLFLTEMTPEAEEELCPQQWEIHTRYPRTAPAGVRVSCESRETALPRAYLASHWIRADAETALQRVTRGDFDYHTTVLLEAESGMSEPSIVAPGPSFEESESFGMLARACEPARIVSYTPERVVIEADAPGDRILVLTDSVFPGWQAYVDGSEVPIFTANYLFRAVALPAGRHEVRFEYRPRSFRAGAAISGLSLLGLAVILGVCRLAGRRRTSSPVV